MAQFINRLGRRASSGFGGKTITISKSGDWELVELQLNKMVGLPDALGKELVDIAEIIRQSLEDTKANGDFAPNTEATLALKSNPNPWNDDMGVTGVAVIDATGTGKSGVSVRLDGDMEVQLFVNEGFYDTWAQEYIEGRNLYGQAWQNCEAEVRSKVDDLVASYVG